MSLLVSVLGMLTGSLRIVCSCSVLPVLPQSQTCPLCAERIKLLLFSEAWDPSRTMPARLFDTSRLYYDVRLRFQVEQPSCSGMQTGKGSGCSQTQGLSMRSTDFLCMLSKDLTLRICMPAASLFANESWAWHLPCDEFHLSSSLEGSFLCRYK